MIRNISVSLLVVALVLMGFGCDTAIKTSDQDIKQLAYKELRTMLADSKQTTVLLDPRSPARYGEGHLEGAVNLPLADLTTGETALANAVNIVVYGTTWTDYLSPAAAKKLMALGYKNVSDFRGGLDAWKNEGGKIVSSAAPTTQPSDQTPNTN